MSIVAIATLTYTSGGAPGATSITFSNTTNVVVGQVMSGQGINTVSNNYVIGIVGNTVTLSAPLIAQASGTYFTYATSATETGPNVFLGKIAFTWKGNYSAGATYVRQDVVYYNGSSYVCLQDNTVGQTPASLTAYWQTFTQGVSSVSTNAGEVVYNNGSGLVALPPGTLGQVLTINALGMPSWANPDIRTATKVKALIANGMAQQNTMYRHNLVVMQDNTVKGWGWNGNHVLGNGTTNNRSYPARIAFPPSFPGASKVFANYNYNGYCIDVNGQLWSWGYNTEGQCGDGTTTVRRVPYNASANPSNSIFGKTIVDVQVGMGVETGTCVTVLCSDGTVHATGYNVRGQIGDGSTTTKTNFVQNAVLNNVIKIAQGRELNTAVYAVTASGQLYSWGYNGDGQLGNGNTTNSTIAALRTTGVLSGKFVYDVCAGFQTAFAECYSTTVTATAAYASGGVSGQKTITLASITGVSVSQIVTGTGIPALTHNVKPTRVVSIAGNTITLSNNLTLQAAGTYNFYNAGFVAGWGTNTTYGPLGDGTFANQFTPVQIFAASSTNPVEEIFSANYDYPVSWCKKYDNTWHVAGAGAYGANLDPADANRSSWVQIAPAGVTSSNYIIKVIKSGTGSYNWMAALDVTGNVYTWGYNGNGALGLGDTVNRNLGVIARVPVDIRKVVDIQAHGGGTEQDLVMLLDDGQLWITGYGGDYANTEDRAQQQTTAQPVLF